eukprot:gene18022-17869_t
MSTQIHTQDAIRTLTNAFAPMNCLIMAARKGCFSFTLVNEHGIARHSERLYPDQYSSAEPLQAVIERTRQALGSEGSMGIAASELCRYVIRPTLIYLGRHSQTAESLLLGVAASQSELGSALHDRRGHGLYRITES